MPPTDYDALMQRNLTAVFSERDPDARRRAIADLYADEPTLYEPANVVRGRDAISDTVGRLLQTLPPNFTFTAAGPAVGHHGVCCVQWRGGPPDKPPMTSGTDVAHLEHDTIKALYVLIDPAVR